MGRGQSIFQCPYCLYTGNLVWVHGHGQCPQCTLNIDECCRGETCQPVTTKGPQSGLKPS